MNGLILSSLICKFPSFEPEWPEIIKDKWFEEFQILYNETKKYDNINLEVIHIPT
jgi:hypothetical protein